MKKLFVIILLALMLVSSVSAIVTVGGSSTPPKPAVTGVNNPSGTGTSGTTSGPKITGINNPLSYGGGATTGTAAGKVGTKYYYVVGANTQLPDGTHLSAGQTLVLDQDVSSNAAYADLKPINAEQYRFTQAYAGQYTYQGESKFTSQITKQSDNAFENYQVTTTITITTDANGKTHKVYDETASICGKGLTKCDGTYTEIKGSHITVEDITESATKPPQPGQKGVPETRDVVIDRIRTIYGSDGEEKGKLATHYDRSDSTDVFSTRIARDVTFTGVDGTVYYQATYNKNTGETTIAVNNIDTIPGLSRQEKDHIREQIAASGAIGFGDALQTLTWYQSLGRFMRAYNEYAGLRQITSIFWPAYDEEVQARKEKIQQQFCLAAGITNCAISTICGTIYNIQADNILAGRGPGGSYVSSASLNAERSLPIDVEGMTRQQLIDLFGNSTVIKGVWINLTDPNFNPKILGVMRLRLYHVQYSVTNNAEDKKDLNYNIVFNKVPQGLNSSYGAPVGSARWWKTDQTISNLQSARDDVYKFSATEYNAVCLKFDPKLPSGHAAFSQLVDELCVPFAEYAGGPTEITIPTTNATQGAAAGPSAAVAETPGALV